MNKSMIKYEESFIVKIRRILKNLFRIHKQSYNFKQETSNTDEEKKEQVQFDFLKEIKVDNTEIISEHNKKMFIFEISKNPQILDSLSIDRLKVLDGYCDDIIKQNEDKIKLLKR